MTVRVPILNTDTDTAETFRLALGGLWVPVSALNPRTGVTTIPVLTGTGNLTATVGPFTAMIDGTSGALQGGYPVALDTATTVTIGAGNTQARIDLISLQVQDNDYDASGQHRGIPVVTAGTPSGSPVAPATPANAIPLWTVPVAANATSVTWGSATAVFPYTAAAGGIVPVRNAADQPAAANGVQYRHRLDVTAAAGSSSPLESSPDGTTWTPVYAAPGAWTTYTPTIYGAGSSIGNGTLVGSYTKSGRVVTARGQLTIGSTTNFNGNAIGWSLPFTSASASDVGARGWWAGSAYGQPGTGNDRCGAALVSGSDGNVHAMGDNVGYWRATTPITWASGDRVNMEVTYESVS